MYAGFDEIPYKGAPFVWGSLQDTSPMTLVYQGAPYVVVNEAPGTKYTMDSLGRLTQASYANGSIASYAYDACGNRTTTVTSAGPFGL
jgi:YD repeat-containing protein